MRAPGEAAPGAFEYARAVDLAERPGEQRWLVEGLWADAGVGIIGGAPKCLKTWVSLELAISVATATPCLGRFAVPSRGPVLLYAAEDPLHTVRERLDSLCRARGIALAELDVCVITEPVIRLDRPSDRDRLRRTLDRVAPRVLILDPLVRIYGKVDENSAAEVSGLLAFLRAIQREYDVAVVLVHHARKAQAGVQAGQALRGSGDFHAWGDSMIYLRRMGDGLTLSIEHRSAPSPEPIDLELVTQDGTARLAIVPQERRQTSLTQRVMTRLEAGPATTDAIRDHLGLRKSRVIGLMRSLEAAGRVRRQDRAWFIADPPAGPTHSACDGG
jgi:hypothetical protein